MKTPLRILYAEDSGQDADLTRSHFAEHAPDLELEVVETGQVCLERLRNGTYDLLLLDHRLPDMDGLDVLRDTLRRDISVPVVLVTGSGDEELVVKALRLGASTYVPKEGKYVETLPDLMRMVVEEHQLKMRQGLLPRTPRRVLYVEHNSMDVELTVRHFAQEGPQYTLDVSRSSADALARLSQTPPYDAVLIDLRMPDESGLDLVRNAKLKCVSMPPFIMISGQGDESAAIAAMKLGAADYVCKNEGYLDRLIHATEKAIAYDHLSRVFAQLQSELTARKQAEEERNRLEAQIAQSQKMEAIGSLAGGIAHDFNNLLSVILSYTDVTIKNTADADPRKADLMEVKKAGEKAAVLTRQLLTFSRKQLIHPVSLNLNSVASGLEKMLRRILREDIEFVQVLSPDLGPIMADPGQVEQVLMNLVVNARDAMPDGGRITVETDNVRLDEEYCRSHVGLKPGLFVRLSVSDTGQGMDETTRQRVFEPFFTTKDKGKGTGLGLSTVYGIVTQCGGSIHVYSELGHGTTFKVYFPWEMAGSPRVESPPPSPSLVRSKGNETILVVDDEEALRKVVKRTLEAAGYRVLTASDGEEALAVCARHMDDINLILTDVVMPRMGGKALVENLVRIRPSLRILYMSGYTDHSISHRGLLDSGIQLLSKPFTGAALTKKIREVLDGESLPSQRPL